MSKAHVKDLTGKKFGRLTVLSFSHSNKVGQGYWLCKCSCGNEHIAGTGNLNKGHVTSCGCYRKEKVYESNRRSLGEAESHQTFLTYKHNAKTRGMSFELSENEFIHLSSLNCFYCGNSPSNKSHGKGSYGAFIYNGLDRIDSSKGYIKENVVPCCRVCNRAKMDMSSDEFIGWIFRISDYSMSNKIYLSTMRLGG